MAPMSRQGSSTCTPASPDRLPVRIKAAKADRLGAAITRNSGTRAASAAFSVATATASNPAAAAAAAAAQDPGNGPDPAVQAELADEHEPAQRGGGDRSGRREYGHRNAQVETASALGQAGRGKPDRDPARRPGLAAVHDRGPDPVAGLAKGGVGQPDQQQRFF